MNIGFWGLLYLIIITLKLLDIITWSWLVVFALPVVFGIIVLLVLCGLVFLFGVLSEKYGA